MRAGSVIEDMDIPVYRGVSVSGVVTVADVIPAAYVKVTGTTPGNWTIPETFTDEFGRFEFWDFSDGAVICLRAEGAGRRSKLEGPLTVPAGGLSDVQLVLDEACDAAIAGTVVDGSGNPIAAVVCCTPVNADTFVEDPRRFERTASDGVFLIAGLPAGDYALGLGPGRTDFMREVVSAMTVHLDPGQVRAGVRLVFDDSKIAKISGRVTDTDGNPVAFADVTTRSSDGAHSMGTTNKDGEYIVWGVGKGPITVHATHSQYAEQYKEGVSPGDTNVDIVLLRPGRISGQVIDAATGQPIEEFDIADRPDGVPMSFRHVRDSEGRFSFTTSSMVVELMVKAPGYVSTRHQLRPAVRPGESLEDIEIELAVGVEAPSDPQDVPQFRVLAPVQR